MILTHHEAFAAHTHTQTNRRPATPQTTQFLSGSLWFLELQLAVERHLFWVTQGSGSMAYQSLLHFASFRLWTYSTAWFNHDVLSDLHCFIHAVASLTILERWRREAARVPLQQVPLVTHWWLIDDSLRCTVSAPFELTKLLNSTPPWASLLSMIWTCQILPDPHWCASPEDPGKPAGVKPIVLHVKTNL